MEGNKEQTCLLSVSHAFHRNCSKVLKSQKSKDMAPKLPVSGQFQEKKEQKKKKRNEKR